MLTVNADVLNVELPAFITAKLHNLRGPLRSGPPIESTVDAIRALRASEKP